MTGPTKPRFQAQIEGTTLPCFGVLQGKNIWYFGRDDIRTAFTRSQTSDTIRQIAFNARAALARIVAEHRRK